MYNFLVYFQTKKEEDFMKDDYKLIEDIYKDASMGVYTMNKLLDSLKDKDNKIKNYAEEILKKYEEFVVRANDELKENNLPPIEEGFITKMMSAMGISKEVKSDNSDSAIADLLIKGISMGSIEMEKKISLYKDSVEKEYLKLAKDFLKFQEKTIDELKKYL